MLCVRFFGAVSVDLSKRTRIAAMPASITAAGSRPSCLYSPGLRRVACARMMAAYVPLAVVHVVIII